MPCILWCLITMCHQTPVGEECLLHSDMLCSFYCHTFPEVMNLPVMSMPTASTGFSLLKQGSGFSEMLFFFWHDGF